MAMKAVTLSIDEVSVNVISAVEDSVCCLLCSKILRDPHQAPCGCRFCLECIRDRLRDTEKICPGPTEECRDSKLNLEKDIRPDPRAKREINKLIVKCPFVSCQEEYEFRVMKDHLKICRSTRINCTLCNESVTREEYGRHSDIECPEVVVSCAFCTKDMKRREMKEEHHNYSHDELCDKYVDICPEECDERKPVIWIEHRRMCGNKTVMCPYQVIGCGSDAGSLREVSKHIVDKGFDHAEIMLKHIDNLNNEISYLTNAIATVSKEMTRFTPQVCEDEASGSNTHKEDIARLENTMKEMKREYHSTQPQFRNFIKKQIGISLRNNECDQSLAISRIKNEIDAMKIEVQLIKTNRIERNNVVMNWIIIDFHKTYRLTSQSFYTHPMGYKMDLTMDKNKKGFVSIFARLKAGEFDADLSWPFRKKVILQIVDQDKMNRNYERVIRFGEQSGEISERKVLGATGDFGYEEFIRKKELSEKPYLIRNDRLWIACFVDELVEPNIEIESKEIFE